MSPRSIYAQHVVLGEGDGLRVGPAVVEIEGGRIVRVLEGEPAATVDEDLGPRVLAPAFINAHTHLAMVGFRGLVGQDALRGNVVEDLFFRLESSMSAEDVRAFTRLGALECMRHGTARVWDHYYFAESIAAGLDDVGMSGVVAPTLQDLAGPGTGQREQQLEATVALCAPKWALRGIHAAVGPHATDTVSASLWRSAVSLARDQQLPLHAHVAQSVEEYRRIDERHGLSPMAWLEHLGVLAQVPRLLAVHAIFVSDRDLARLDPSRHTLGYCPLSQQQFCFPAHVPSWHRDAIPWVVGTDCAMSNDSMNVQRELVNIAGVRTHRVSSGDLYAAFRRNPSAAAAHTIDRERKALLESHGPLTDARTLLASVWSIPGRLHPAFTAGIIEPGAEADFIVVDTRHPALWPGRDVLRALAYCDTSAAIDGLMIRGQWRFAPGERGAWEQAELHREAREEAEQRLHALEAVL